MHLRSKIVSEFCLDFVFCRRTKKRDKIENTDFRPILSSVDPTTTIESDKIQTSKHEIRPVLYFVFCRPLGTTFYCTQIDRGFCWEFWESRKLREQYFSASMVDRCFAMDKSPSKLKGRLRQGK